MSSKFYKGWEWVKRVRVSLNRLTTLLASPEAQAYAILKIGNWIKECCLEQRAHGRMSERESARCFITYIAHIKCSMTIGHHNKIIEMINQIANPTIFLLLWMHKTSSIIVHTSIPVVNGVDQLTNRIRWKKVFYRII